MKMKLGVTCNIHRIHLRLKAKMSKPGASEVVRDTKSSLVAGKWVWA